MYFVLYIDVATVYIFKYSQLRYCVIILTCHHFGFVFVSKHATMYNSTLWVYVLYSLQLRDPFLGFKVRRWPKIDRSQRKDFTRYYQKCDCYRKSLLEQINVLLQGLINFTFLTSRNFPLPRVLHCSFLNIAPYLFWRLRHITQELNIGNSIRIYCVVFILFISWTFLGRLVNQKGRPWCLPHPMSNKI